MEKVTQTVSLTGLQIPLDLMQKYGLPAGADVVMEFDDQGIRIVPAVVSQQEIEKRALLFLLTSLGDAVSVTVKQQADLWQATVFGAGLERPLGQLIYNIDGTQRPELSDTPAHMREQAIQAYQDQ